MAINRILWKNPFHLTQVPKWNCPTCSIGILKLKEEYFIEKEAPSSLNDRKNEEWEPDWIYGVFSGILECNNQSCGDFISICGKMRANQQEEYYEELNRVEIFCHNYMYIELAIPELNIFNIENDVPDNIKTAIRNSFKLFWTDNSSCGNKIRTVVELIMDDKKVKKTYMVKGKRKNYMLHNRIEQFKITNPLEAEYLMAIKWLGNSGSHTSDELTRDDILDGFEILELVTTKIYEKNTSRINLLSKKINKQKGPIKKN